MEVVTCPGDVTRADIDTPIIFVAGGISNCPDWQKEIIQMFSDIEDVILVNPRRYDFNITDTNMSRAQIHWEHKYLEEADAILFWFPKETLCPITLFELGKYLRSYKPIFVGCHPEYARKFDVEVQLELCTLLPVVDNIPDLVKQVRGWVLDQVKL